MFLGIIPIISAGVSILGGLLGAKQRSDQARRQNETIFDLMEHEKKKL